MPKLPRITAKKAMAALAKIGFVVIRRKGSHHFLRHPDGRSTVIPVHAGEILGPGLLKKILRDCEVTVDAFPSLL